MLQENKIKTIFDEHFPKQVLPSPVASRIKQQMHQQLQINRQTYHVTNPAKQRQKIDLRFALWQWWDSLQVQPMPSFALAGAAVVFIFSAYFLVQANLLTGLEIDQGSGNIGSTTVIPADEDSVTQTNAGREPEVVLIIPTIDDMRLSNNSEALQAVAIADTATPMPIMPTSLPEVPAEQIILRPTSTAEPTAHPAAMDHPQVSITAAASTVATAQPIAQSIAQSIIVQPTTQQPTVLETAPTRPAIAVAIENILPTPMAQMPTPNHNLSQAEIIVRPTPTLYIISTPLPQPIAPTPTLMPTATFVPTVPPTNSPDNVMGAGDRSGMIGQGPSVPPGLAATGATATAQADYALAVINQVPTLLPPSQIVASPLAPILPTATPFLPTPVPVPPTLVSATNILPFHTPTEIPMKIAEGIPTEIIPSPTLLPTFTSIPTEIIVETVAETMVETVTPTPRPPEPTSTPRPQSNSNNNNNKNNNNKDSQDENRGDHADPRPTATPVPQVVHVPVEPPTAPPPVPTAAPATAIPAPSPIPPTQPPPTQPPTQSPPTSTPEPVHTATSAPTKRPPTVTPARVEINPIVGVPEPTAKPTAIVQLPTQAPEPIRESGKGVEPVTGKDSNPVKPIFTPTSSPDHTKPTPMRVEINPVQESPKAVPTLTPRPTSKPIVLDSEAVSDSLLGHDETAELESATE